MTDAPGAGAPSPGGDEPARTGHGTHRPRRAAVLALAAVPMLGLGVAAVFAATDSISSTTAPSDTATPSASPVRPPDSQVRTVHDALHDIDARCRQKAAATDPAPLQRDADRVAAFARQYPNARFPIDDESGTTLSLLLVTRQALLSCAPDAAATVDRALPAEFRTPASTPGGRSGASGP